MGFFIEPFFLSAVSHDARSEHFTSCRYVSSASQNNGSIARLFSTANTTGEAKANDRRKESRSLMERLSSLPCFREAIAP
jgi:hypothetical protein